MPNHKRDLTGWLRGYRPEPGAVRTPPYANVLSPTIIADDVSDLGPRLTPCTQWISVNSPLVALRFSGVRFSGGSDGAYLGDLSTIAPGSISLIGLQRGQSAGTFAAFPYAGTLEGMGWDGSGEELRLPELLISTGSAASLAVPPRTIYQIGITGTPALKMPIYIPPGNALEIYNTVVATAITLHCRLTDASLRRASQ